MAQERFNVSDITGGAFRLVPGGEHTGMESAAVKRTKVELAVDHRLVLAPLGQVFAHLPPIAVDAHDIAILCGSAENTRRPNTGITQQTAAEIELVRRDRFECLADDAEILLGDLGVEGFQVRVATLP